MPPYPSSRMACPHSTRSTKFTLTRIGEGLVGDILSLRRLKEVSTLLTGDLGTAPLRDQKQVIDGGLRVIGKMINNR